MKAVFFLLEFFSLILVYLLLRMTGRPLEPIYLIAWNPFFIFEFSHSGHSDSAMMFCTYLTILMLLHKRHSWAFVSYTGAVLSKLHPALWFPLFLRRSGWRSMVAGVAVGTAFFAYYFTPVSALGYIKELRLYFRLFEFNAGIHYLLRYIGHAVFDQSWDKVTGPYLAVILLIVSVSIACKFPLRDNLDLLHAGFWIMTADLCLATTVHPWYISWAALALPFFPYAFMIYWTGACFLSYVAYSYHPVFEPAWSLVVEYLPMYLLMSWEIYLGRPLCLPRHKELTLPR